MIFKSDICTDVQEELVLPLPSPPPPLPLPRPVLALVAMELAKCLSFALKVFM